MTEIKLDLKDPNLMYSNCPICGESWDGGLIADEWKKLREDNIKNGVDMEGNWFNKTDEEFEELAKADYSEPYKFSELIGIEVQGYDRTMAYMCPKCRALFSSWDGKHIGVETTATETMKLIEDNYPIKLTNKL